MILIGIAVVGCIATVAVTPTVVIIGVVTI
jgi:hypothetical protein